MFASVEHVRDDFTGVQHCVSFGAIPEYKAFEQDGLKDGGNDEGEVNEDTGGHVATSVGRWKDEFGEDDP